MSSILNRTQGQGKGQGKGKAILDSRGKLKRREPDSRLVNAEQDHSFGMLLVWKDWMAGTPWQRLSRVP